MPRRLSSGDTSHELMIDAEREKSEIWPQMLIRHAAQGDEQCSLSKPQFFVPVCVRLLV